MSLFASWRTALRIARREAARAKGRSTMVAAMIAVPVACLAFAASTYDMFDLNAEEKSSQTMGTADARIRWRAVQPVEQNVEGDTWETRAPTSSGSGPGDVLIKPGEPQAPTEAELLAKLPAGSKVTSIRTGTATVATEDGVAEPNVVVVDAESPLTAGYLVMLAGRAPEAVNEVALSKKASDRFHQGVGGTITSGDGSRVYTVVGLVEFPSGLNETLLFAPSLPSDTKGLNLNPYEASWLADTPAPITWANIKEYNKVGISMVSRAVLLDPPPADEIGSPYGSGGIPTEELAIGVIVAGLALLEIVLLAGPAFAVSARRRQRQLALVAANGGTPAHVRRIVLADGVVLGLLGAAGGIVLGIAAAFLARPFIEVYLVSYRAGGYRVFPLALIAIAALAVFTGVLAAMVPAFIIARQNVISSLAGRRGATRSKKRWIAVGLALIAAGTPVVIYGAFNISAYTMLAGLVLAELGLVFCTPGLVGLISRLGRFLPLAPRIALRDAARNRAAAAPAISAVMAAVAGSVAIGLYFQSNIVMQEEHYRASAPVGYATVFLNSNDKTLPSQADVDKALRSILPVVDVRTTSTYTCGREPDRSRTCEMRVVVPEENACPFLSQKHEPYSWPNEEEQLQAAKDPRCDDVSLNSTYLNVVDDATALPVLTGANSDDLAAATAVLRSGGIVLPKRALVHNAKATIDVLDTGPNGELVDDKTQMPLDNAWHTITVPAYVLSSGTPLLSPIASPGLVKLAGLEVATEPNRVIASTSRMPTQTEEERFNKQIQGIGLNGEIEHGPVFEIPIELWLIMAAAALITLGAAGIGTGLAAADGRADLSTLASVGASPRLRRGLSLSQSAVIAGLGSVLGAGAGLGAAVAVLFAINQSSVDLWPAPTPRPIVVPWISLGVALIVVPVIAMLGAGLLTRSRLPIERRL